MKIISVSTQCSVGGTCCSVIRDLPKPIWGKWLRLCVQRGINKEDKNIWVAKVKQRKSHVIVIAIAVYLKWLMNDEGVMVTCQDLSRQQCPRRIVQEQIPYWALVSNPGDGNTSAVVLSVMLPEIWNHECLKVQISIQKHIWNYFTTPWIVQPG